MDKATDTVMMHEPELSQFPNKFNSQTSALRDWGLYRF